MMENFVLDAIKVHYKMNKIKESNIKNCTCCYFDDLININNLMHKNIINKKFYQTPY